MASRDPSQPNIIFILSDDQGPWALGCAGNSEISTPHLDRLAARGLRLDNFFCTSPVCSPARASLLTGRIPSQHGIHDWIRQGNSGENAVEYLAGQLAYTELLAAQGYLCGLSGKWHLGDSHSPQKGFSHWYVHQRGGGPYYGAPMIRDGQLEQNPGYVTDLITDDALAFLDAENATEQPFCLHVHYTAPHSPWLNSHPEDIVEFYAECQFDSCPQEPRHPWANALQDAHENPRPNLMGYFAAVTAMDSNIGRLLDKLDRLGLTSSTLVFFTSDNGFNCGHHGIWGKGNGTFPQNMFDSSVKVPAIVSHPGQIAEGRTNEALLSGYDVMPTILDYLGIKHPSAKLLPGRSFAPLLRGQADSSEGFVIVFDEYGPVRMIRNQAWKYIHRYPYGPHELYNLERDPDERQNLVDEPDLVHTIVEMRAQMENWFFTYTDPAADGRLEAVTGDGQIYLSGPQARGRKAFATPSASVDRGGI